MKNLVNILLILFIIVVLGFLVFMMKDTIAFKIKGLEGQKSAFTDYKVEKPKNSNGNRVEFKDLVTSTGSMEKKYYRYDLSLETVDSEGASKLQENSDAIAAIINSVMSSFKPEEIDTTAKRQRLKLIIFNKIYERYPNIKIKDLYFTNFVYN